MHNGQAGESTQIPPLLSFESALKRYSYMGPPNRKKENNNKNILRREFEYCIRSAVGTTTKKKAKGDLRTVGGQQKIKSCV